MSSLSQRLHLGVQQKQVLTPGLVQMVTVLQLNRMELKDMIINEIAENPVLEEATEPGEELTQGEVQDLLERVREGQPADQDFLERGDAGGVLQVLDTPEPEAVVEPFAAGSLLEAAPIPADPAADKAADPFEEIDFGSFFDDYLDPGFKSPASENVEKPSFETFLSSPITLADHLQSQLSVLVMPEAVRDAAVSIIGNLDEYGRLTASLEEIAESDGRTAAEMEEALRVVQSLDPAGIAGRDLRECLLLQLESRNARGGVAWQIVHQHLKLVQSRQYRDLARLLGRPAEHIQIAVHVIRRLDPWPGLRYSAPGARQVEPDVYISKDGDEYLIQLNEDDLPQLRLNAQYKRMLDRDQEPSKEVRNY